MFCLPASSRLHKYKQHSSVSRGHLRIITCHHCPLRHRPARGCFESKGSENSAVETLISLLCHSAHRFPHSHRPSSWYRVNLDEDVDGSGHVVGSDVWLAASRVFGQQCQQQASPGEPFLGLLFSDSAEHLLTTRLSTAWRCISRACQRVEQ